MTADHLNARVDPTANSLGIPNVSLSIKNILFDVGIKNHFHVEWVSCRNCILNPHGVYGGASIQMRRVAASTACFRNIFIYLFFVCIYSLSVMRSLLSM
jgi:hypothetical protein